MIMNRPYANELKQTEKECRQTEERLIEAQRLMLVGYWEWNLETKKYGWCDEMYRIFNLTPQQSPLRTGTFFNCVHPEDREKVVKALGKALVGEHPFNIEHRIVWTDGSVRFVHGKAEVTFDGGKPIRILGIVQDITDRRQVEEL
jgi:PAS domain S-box-containing protein